MGRTLWLLLGFTSVGAGAIGAVLPLIPTTPFLLVAAFAFARSSPDLHRRLLAHPQFGPIIDNWRRYGAIDRRSKIFAVLMMAAALALSAILHAPLLLLLVQTIILAASATFILTRPGAPR